MSVRNTDLSLFLSCITVQSEGEVLFPEVTWPQGASTLLLCPFLGFCPCSHDRCWITATFTFQPTEEVSGSLWQAVPVKRATQSVSHSVAPHSLRPHGLYSARLLCPWDFPGKNTGVGSHSLPRDGTWLSHTLQADSLPSEPLSD